MSEEQFDAATLVEELAEKLTPEPPPGPKYISVAPLLNRATRRRMAKLQRLQVKRFEKWKRDLTAAGIDWRAVLEARKEKAA